jgi:hypothetical protein
VLVVVALAALENTAAAVLVVAADTVVVVVVVVVADIRTIGYNQRSAAPAHHSYYSDTAGIAQTGSKVEPAAVANIEHSVVAQVVAVAAAMPADTAVVPIAVVLVVAGIVGIDNTAAVAGSRYCP